MFSAQDYQMMARAIELAQRGKYTTAPNPNVGCVITRDGDIVGEGFHFRAGEPHAEVHALRMAGDKAQGATAYVTLEPCSHYGRTPPCAEGLINAQVAKVVCAMQDPNPQVAGRGIEMLRAAGIEVQVGLLEQDAVALNPFFLKRMHSKMPYVQLKLAASLDGQTALSNGESQWITSPEARQDVQRYRAQSSAILSTSQTVIADDASLNVRFDDLPASLKLQYSPTDLRQPVRVILDRQGQLHPELKLFNTPGEVLVVGPNGALNAPLGDDGRVDLFATFASLAQDHNINQLWIEAGPTLAQSVLKAGLVDELILYVAPKLMGSDGRGLLGALGLGAMSECIELDIQDIRMVGKDIRVVAKLANKES